MAAEAQRGCGYRKIGGLYMVSGKLGAGCGRLPLPLERCPACGAGFKPSRGWTWVKPAEVFANAPKCGAAGALVAKWANARLCRACPASDLSRLGERAGLLWAGEQFYPTPSHFMLEAESMGVSRRISAVPRGFKLGETWVLIAHRKAIPAGDVMLPGVITMFRPQKIEIMLPQMEAENAKLAAYVEKRGLTPVYLPQDDDDHYDEAGMAKVYKMRLDSLKADEEEGP